MSDFLVSLSNNLPAIATEGLIYGIMAIGVFITFRVLDFPDLTVDGSFPLGAAIVGALLTRGYSQLTILTTAFLGGTTAGIFTAFIHNRLKVPNLLSGILTMTILWSVNLRIMGRPNTPLLKQETLFTYFTAVTGLSTSVVSLLIALLAAVMIILLLILFFRCDVGLALGAVGNNEQMVISIGVNPETLKYIGVGLSNGLVAFSGALMAQKLGYSDIQMGQGIIVMGLAMVMIGEFFHRSNRISIILSMVAVGSIVYRLLMFLAMDRGFSLGLKATDRKMLTGFLIIIAIVLAQARRRRKRIR